MFSRAPLARLWAGRYSGRMQMRGILVGLLLTVALCSVASAQQQPRRSVLLLVADDLGLDLGCYGNGHARTPNLDVAGKNGVPCESGW